MKLTLQGLCHSSRAFMPEPGLGQGMGAQHGHVHEPRYKRQNSQQNMEQLLPAGEGLVTHRNLMEGDGRYARTRSSPSYSGSSFRGSGNPYQQVNNSPPRSPMSRSSSYGPPSPMARRGSEQSLRQAQAQAQAQAHGQGAGYGSVGRTARRGDSSPRAYEQPGPGMSTRESVEYGQGQRRQGLRHGIREEELQELEGSVAAMGVSGSGSANGATTRQTVENWREGSGPRR
jgi:hypothetical protein